MSRIGFVGGGNMAEAIIKGIISAKLFRASEIYVSDISAERLAYLEQEYDLVTTGDNSFVVDSADIVVLSVKPQKMQEALASITAAMTEEKLVVSIAAGVPIETISSALGGAAVVRVMPNTPALVGEGASGLYANEKAKGRLAEVESIFNAVGAAVVLDSEDLMDAVTAVSGSGPAYFFLLMEELAKAGAELGLPAELAMNLTLQTALGATSLAVEADKKEEGPAELRSKVTSPGGTTQAALETFAAGGFAELVHKAVVAARDRSRELSK